VQVRGAAFNGSAQQIVNIDGHEIAPNQEASAKLARRQWGSKKTREGAFYAGNMTFGTGGGSRGRG